MKKQKTQKKRFFFSFISPKRYIVGIFFFSILLSLFFSLFKLNQSPPCINADEAAFGYNAYSLLKTGADEYGNTLPVRLKSFGDYKMPLYSYATVPFVGAFGLNDVGIRSLNILLALLFPVVIYFLTKELFEKDEVAVIASLLISVSLGKGIVERHAHEALLAAILISLATLFFIRFVKKEQMKDGLFFSLALFLSLFAYQSSRLFAVFFVICAIIYWFYRKKITKTKILIGVVLLIALCISAIPDVIYKPERVKTLLLTNNAGFIQKVVELRGEGGNPIFYNKATMAVREILLHEASYFSPQFLVEIGDPNKRFGYPGMSPMTLFEYLFIFIGFYYLFKNKERWRYFLLGLILIAPLSGAFSWADVSLTRALFLLVPLLIVSAYGMYQILAAAAKQNKLKVVLPLLLLIEIVFLFYSWDFYFNHYPQRALVTRSWQCGYKELSDYVKENYDKKSAFYITKKNGEPYIFMLYYLQYPPEKYQKQASLTAADEYGFGQVEKFDKFIFSFPPDAVKKKNIVLVGYPDDFNQIPNIDTKKIKKIIINNEEIFWIYET